ncbi:MAG: leader peptidase (prepilin peptidase)/N-methyltransferase, partial [Gammaproteobacteria bacterium]
MFQALDNVIVLISQHAIIYYPGVLILGLLIGSFLNVVIFRIPKMMEQEFRAECRDFLEVSNKENKKNIILTLSTPNSTCPSCDKPIKPWHNIPVISYFFLKG